MCPERHSWSTTLTRSGEHVPPGELLLNAPLAQANVHLLRHSEDFGHEAQADLATGGASAPKP